MQRVPGTEASSENGFRSGDLYSGLEVEVEGVKLLRVVRCMKTAGYFRRVKWEGYDETVDEPGGEPVFWGPNDPQRLSNSNVDDYPAMMLVPGCVVGETPSDEPYWVSIRATADMQRWPGCTQVYRRWSVPLWVKYDMQNP